PDADYALSWIHTYGRGRVFFTALGHTPAFFASPNLSDFFFRRIQFVLGDLDADSTPSTKVGTANRRCRWGCGSDAKCSKPFSGESLASSLTCSWRPQRHGGSFGRSS